VHGNVYKQPDISQDTVDSLANKFLIGTSIQDLPADQQDQARNVTRSIFVVQQKDVNVTVNLENDVSADPNATGGVVNAVINPILWTRVITSRSGKFEADMINRKGVLKSFSSHTRLRMRVTLTPLWSLPMQPGRTVAI
jgi:hypothetical protein